ncbi:MAG: glutathione peroxidase [Flavobacteriales bacterium]|nr:glutathione peroxidase [Flavobacteriales bacterium]
MKKIKLAISSFFISLISIGASGQSGTVVEPKEPVYNYSIQSLTGAAVNLADFKGKKILFVNVASKCGFTPQYEELQKLSEQYKDKLIIIGLPCNQFGAQEAGTSEEIATFCQVNYGVTFLITEKIKVKGKEQHDIYKWLTSADKNGKLDSKVKWNFQKYLVDEKGRLINVLYSSTTPLSKDITDLL